MSNQQESQDPAEGVGYHTPGQDKIVESKSQAVPSPSKTSEERLADPKPVIESLGETVEGNGTHGGPFEGAPFDWGASVNHARFSASSPELFP